MFLDAPFSGEKYADTIVKLRDYSFADFKTRTATFSSMWKVPPPVLQMELYLLELNLTNEYLQTMLRISFASSLKPNVAQLCKRKRC